MTRIAIRVDASARMGMGHAKRCLSLARALIVAGADVRLVHRDLGLAGLVAAAAAEAGVACTLLPAPDALPPASGPPAHAAWAGTDWRTDSAESIAALADFVPDWLVIDHYSFDARWHDAVRAALGCRIAAVDDLADRMLAADLVLDHNLHPDHRAKYAGKLQDGVRLLAGPRFALLDPAYAAAPRHEFREAVRSVGIFMGGTDQPNHSATALAAVAASGFAGQVEIVSTSGNPNLAALEAAVAARANTQLTLDLPDLAGFFARHDLQIGAGGGATWERLCIGAPSVLLPFAENHDAVLLPLAQQGAAEVLAWGWTAADLGAAIAALLGAPARRAALAAVGRTLVDGLGAQRAALALEPAALALRPATMDDCRCAFEWRNDPSVRAVSRQSQPLDWEAHQRWFAATLASSTRRLYVGAVGEVDIGHIRLDTLDDQRAEVSFYLDPRLNGLGLGAKLLAAVESMAPSDSIIVGEVLPGNDASHRLFEKTGYQRVEAGRWEKRLRSHKT